MSVQNRSVLEDGKSDYRLPMIQSLRDKGFDHDALLAVAKVEREEGRAAFDHHISTFLDAIKNSSLTDLFFLFGQTTAPQEQPANGPSATLYHNVSIDMPTVTSFPDAPFESAVTRAETIRPSTAHLSTASVEPARFTSTYCLELGCKTDYVSEQWFVNHVMNRHQGLNNEQSQCCGHDFSGSDIDPFARHVWQQHKVGATTRNKPSNSQERSLSARVFASQTSPYFNGPF